MTIRNIITAAAMVAVLGLAGGSAYANDSDSHIDDQGFTVSADANYPGTVFVYNEDSDVDYGKGFIVSADANYPGTVFVYNEDSDVNYGEILTGGFARAHLPQPTNESLETN